MGTHYLHRRWLYGDQVPRRQGQRQASCPPGPGCCSMTTSAVVLAKASPLRGERAAPRRAGMAPSAPLYPVAVDPDGQWWHQVHL